MGKLGMYKRWFVAIVIVLGLVLLLWMPVFQDRVISLGTDSFATHHALYDERISSQTVDLEGQLQGVGVILVDLRRAHQLVPVTVDVYAGDRRLAQTTVAIDQIHDDTFAWVTLPDIPANVRQVRFDFSAPEATNQNPIGLRFTDNPDKTIAMKVQERVPLWHSIAVHVGQSAYVQWVLWFLGLAMVVSGLMFVPALLALSPTQRRIFEWSVLLVIALVGIGLRFAALSQLYGVSGGDPYNYLSITKAIVEFRDPFSVGKRLPGWPLLMVPAFVSGLDDIRWMQMLSVLSAGAILIAVSRLARQLKFPWSVQIAVPVVLLFQRDFFWTSLRPEPYTFYAFLVVLSLWMFFQLPRGRVWQQILFGVVVGYAAMTRQEGFVLALVLGICSLAYWKRLWWKGFLWTWLPALLLVLPFFIHNAITFGNPIYTKYFEGERLQIVDSYPAFVDNLGGTWGVIGPMWWPVWDRQVRLGLEEPFVTYGMLLMAGVLILGRWRVLLVDQRWQRIDRRLVGGVGIAALVVVVSTAMMFGSTFGEQFMRLMAGLLLVSALPFILFVRGKAVPVLLVLITQALIALWFHPFPKHFQQDYPLFTLLLVSALLLPVVRYGRRQGLLEHSTSWRERLARLLPAWPYPTAILLSFFVICIGLNNHLPVALDDSNHNTADDHVVYKAVQAIAHLPRPVGFDQPYQQAVLYYGAKDSVDYFLDDPTVEHYQGWLAKSSFKTLVITNLRSPEIVPDPSWHEVASFRAEGKDEKVFESRVYELP